MKILKALTLLGMVAALLANLKLTRDNTVKLAALEDLVFLDRAMKDPGLDAALRSGQCYQVPGLGIQCSMDKDGCVPVLSGGAGVDCFPDGRQANSRLKIYGSELIMGCGTRSLDPCPEDAVRLHGSARRSGSVHLYSGARKLAPDTSPFTWPKP